MSSTVSIKIDWNRTAIGSIERKAIHGLMEMGFDIANEARERAPYLTGALSNTIRVQPTSDTTLEVIAGGTYAGHKVAYAWKREQGPNRNPATVHYMKNSAEHIMSGNYLKKYFGGIA